MTTDLLTSDRIEKQQVLRAARSRVWQALTDSAQFGTWFRAAIDGPFAPGARVTGHMTAAGYEGEPFEILVERIEPETLFSYRWHPYAADPGDLALEPTTLVEFTLSDAPGGTLLRIVESGFDSLPAGRRRDEAFRGNSQGWEFQLDNVRAHVEG